MGLLLLGIPLAMVSNKLVLITMVVWLAFNILCIFVPTQMEIRENGLMLRLLLNETFIPFEGMEELQLHASGRMAGLDSETNIGAFSFVGRRYQTGIKVTRGKDRYLIPFWPGPKHRRRASALFVSAAAAFDRYQARKR